VRNARSARGRSRAGHCDRKGMGPRSSAALPARQPQLPHRASRSLQLGLSRLAHTALGHVVYLPSRGSARMTLLSSGWPRRSGQYARGPGRARRRRVRDVLRADLQGGSPATLRRDARDDPARSRDAGLVRRGRGYVRPLMGAQDPSSRAQRATRLAARGRVSRQRSARHRSLRGGVAMDAPTLFAATTSTASSGWASCSRWSISTTTPAALMGPRGRLAGVPLTG
jgi:hypothetical protein